MKGRARLTLLGIGVLVAAIASLGTPAAASAVTPSDAYTCTGGSVPSGSYKSLLIKGMCMLDDGNVDVQYDVTVAAKAALIAAYSGSDLTVGDDLTVQWHGILVLGCEAGNFPCLNEPEVAHPSWYTYDHVHGSLIGQQPLMMVVHHSTIDGSVTHAAGGGGRTCDVFPFGSHGPPAYSTYEDNTIGESAVVTGLRTCWFGFIRNTVGRSVVIRDNYTADPDGNEVVSNTIGLDLRCKDNHPMAQVGDSSGDPNTVGRSAYGECKTLVG